jgi:hypothetical protein
MRLKLNPVARALATFTAVAGLVTGVTYAALSSSATLTNSTISSTTASLKIWDGDSFESTAPGFTVTGLVPGTPSVGYPLYLKNADQPLKVTVQSSIPASFLGFDNWADVKVSIKGEACGVTIDTDLAALIANPVELPCNNLPANSQGDGSVLATAGNYTVKFNIPAEEVTGSQASVGAFTWTLTGVQP